VKVPSEDLVLHEDLHEKQLQYRKEIEIAQTYRDAKLPEMINTVETFIVKLQDQVASNIAKLDERFFIDSENYNDADKVLEELTQLGHKFDNAEQLSKNYASIQKLFNVNVVQQKELEAGKEKFELIKSLWEAVKNFNEKYKFLFTFFFNLLIFLFLLLYIIHFD
jgi:hypothetical protein